MRDKMPTVTAFIDELRAVFGRDEIDQAIREGMADGTFRACEDGHEVGALDHPVMTSAERTVRLSECSPWNERTTR